MAEKDYKYQSTPTISKIKIGTGTYYIKDAEARTAIDSILADYLKAADIANKVDKETDKSLIDDTEIERLAGITGNEDGSITVDGKTVKNYDDTAVKGLITAEQTRAEGAEADLDKAIKAIDNHSHDNKAELDKIADGDVAKWNAKQDALAFEGTYDASTNKVTTKKYVDDLVGSMAHIEIKVVDTLPATGESNIIYLVPKGADKEGYKEYVWVASATKFEEIGDTDIDLSGYRKAVDQDVIDNAKVDKKDGYSLIADTEIARLAAMSDGANKVEASETNGNIKIDGKETTVYTADKDTVIDADYKHITVTANSVSDGTTTFTKYDDTDLAGRVSTIEGKEAGWDGKQDAITASNKLSADLVADGETNHVFTAADDTKLAGIAEGAQVNVIESIKMNGATLSVTGKEVDLGNIATDARVTTLEGRVTTAEADIDTLEGKVSTLEGKPAYNITTDDIAAWNGEIGAKTAAADEKTRAEGAESALSDRITSLEGQGYEVTVDSKTVSVGGQTAKVAGQTIQDVKATGDINAKLTIGVTSTSITSTGNYTPAGDVSVTLNNNEVLGSIKTAGKVTEIDTTKFSGGSLAAASTATFVKKTINAKISSTDDECLEFFEVASTEADWYGSAVTAQGEYTPAALSEGFYTKGTDIEFNQTTVGVASAAFTGSQGTLSVSGEYDRVNDGEQTATATGVSLNVGDIVVSEKTITTDAMTITVGKEGTYTVSKKTA